MAHLYKLRKILYQGPGRTGRYQTRSFLKKRSVEVIVISGTIDDSSRSPVEEGSGNRLGQITVEPLDFVDVEPWSLEPDQKISDRRLRLQAVTEPGIIEEKKLARGDLNLGREEDVLLSPRGRQCICQPPAEIAAQIDGASRRRGGSPPVFPEGTLEDFARSRVYETSAEDHRSGQSTYSGRPAEEPGERGNTQLSRHDSQPSGHKLHESFSGLYNRGPVLRISPFP